MRTVKFPHPLNKSGVEIIRDSPDLRPDRVVLRRQFHVETRNVQGSDHSKDTDIVIDNNWRLKGPGFSARNTNTDQRQNAGQSKKHAGNDSISSVPMDFGISTRCFGTTPLTLDLLERLRRAEFSKIELHAALPGFDYHNRSLIRSVARWFAENALPPPSLHLPVASPGEDVIGDRPVERQRALDAIKRCLELGDVMGLTFVVLHLGNPARRSIPSCSIMPTPR